MFFEIVNLLFPTASDLVLFLLLCCPFAFLIVTSGLGHPAHQAKHHKGPA